MTNRYRVSNKRRGTLAQRATIRKGESWYATMRINAYRASLAPRFLTILPF